MLMLRRSYERGMRCWSAHLEGRKLPATDGQRGLEGLGAKVSGWSQRANTAGRNVITSRNQLKEDE